MFRILHSATFSNYWPPSSSTNRFSLWNFVAILCTSGDRRIWSSEAAILDFSLLVSSHLVVQYCIYSYWIAGLRKHRYSRWNVVAILCTSWDIRIWSSEATTLDYPFPVTYLLLTIISITPVKCLLPTMWVWALEVLPTSVLNWRYTCIR